MSERPMDPNDVEDCCASAALAYLSDADARECRRSEARGYGCPSCPWSAAPHETARDVRGRLLRLGDYVSVKLYPRGSARGTVVLSARAFVVVGNRRVPALAVRSDEGTIYGLAGPKGVRRLRTAAERRKA